MQVVSRQATQYVFVSFAVIVSDKEATKSEILAMTRLKTDKTQRPTHCTTQNGDFMAYLRYLVVGGAPGTNPISPDNRQ